MKSHHPAAMPACTVEPFEPRLLLTTFALDPFPGVAPWIIHEFQPDSGMGSPATPVAVASAGDLDGDGLADLAVAVRGPGDGPGEVRLLSGRDLSFIRTLTAGEADDERFGERLLFAGDLTGDDIPDLLVASPGAQDPTLPDVTGGRGLVYLFSGADGSVARLFRPSVRHDGAGVPDEFGFALALIPDLDADGLPDLIVGAPGAGDAEQGQAFVLSGASGAELFVLTGLAAGDAFGYAVADAGDSVAPDRPADGVHDILIGAPQHDPFGITDAGEAYLFSGTTGSLLERFNNTRQGRQAYARFGHAVGSYELTFEARNNLVISAPFFDLGSGEDNGVVTLINPDGVLNVRLGYQPGWREGERLTPLGDVTRDGLRDVGITRFQHPEVGGETYIGARPIEGTITANAGDVDGDGLADVISIMPGVGEDAKGLIRVFSSFRIADRSGASGASSDFDQVWFNEGSILLTGGVYTSYAQVPGLRTGDQIRFINARGDILLNPDRFSTEPILVMGGERMVVRDAIAAVVGAEFSGGALRATGLGEDGAVLLEQPDASPPVPSLLSWMFKDGTLTFLWDGSVHDINASGTIIGVGLNGSLSTSPTYVRSPDGTVTTVPGFIGLSIADDGVVAGYIPFPVSERPGDLALWDDGELTVIGPPLNLPSIYASANWSSIEIIDGRRLIGHVTGNIPGPMHTPTGPFFTRTHFYSPQTGLIQQDDIFLSGTTGTIPIEWNQPRLGSTGLWVPQSNAERFRPAPGAPIVPITAAAGSDITAFSLNTLRQLIAFRSSSGRWAALNLATSASADAFTLSEGDLFTAFYDHVGGRTLIARTGPGGTLLLDPETVTVEQDLSLHQSNGISILANLTLFQSTDGRVHLAGTDPDGEWISFFQTGGLQTGVPTPRPLWSSGSISEQLNAAGLSVPVLTGVASYVTPWDGLNIAGIDASGDVHTIWWAPGPVSWRTDNLSEAARTAGRDVAPLSGQLAVYQTPWDGINIAGAVATGGAASVATLWWVPSFGGAWQFDSLSALVDAPLVQPGSLTAFVTPWGSLSVAAIAAESRGDIAAGDIIVFWWAAANEALPGNPSGWRLSSIHDAATTPTATPPAASGRLAAAVSPQGEQHLFATTAGEDASFLTFNWTPSSGAAWAFTNLTAAAV